MSEALRVARFFGLSIRAMGSRHTAIIAGLGIVILLLLVVAYHTWPLKSGFDGGDPCGGCPPGARCAREDGGLGPTYYSCQ